MTHLHWLDSAVALLFVPGDRPERLEKAAQSSADVVAIDWEDALAPDAREAAREATLDYLAGASGDHMVRINGARTPDFTQDLSALAGQDTLSFDVMLTKVESATELDLVASALGDVPIVALIESAAVVAASVTLRSARSISPRISGRTPLRRFSTRHDLPSSSSRGSPRWCHKSTLRRPRSTM